MKKLDFYKYQGCGNDFILIDNHNGDFDLSSPEIQFLCDRRFGIGGDGLMLLGLKDGFDFTMKYYNSDGNPSSFCGNGGRCIVQFAQDLGVVNSKIVHFLFENIPYSAEFVEEDLISLSMQDVEEITRNGDDVYFNTGSPHYIHFMDAIDAFDLIPYSKRIRYSNTFPKGINVNVVEKINEDTIKMRTYERGVEDETYSCGTGVTAAAIALNFLYSKEVSKVYVQTKGGDFQVQFIKVGNRYQSIKLIGPARFVFKGNVKLLSQI